MYILTKGIHYKDKNHWATYILHLQKLVIYMATLTEGLLKKWQGSQLGWSHPYQCSVFAFLAWTK